MRATIDAEILKRLIVSAECDDMLSRCSECGAFFYIDEPGAWIGEDSQGCVWQATRRDQDAATCFRSRNELTA